MIPASAHVSEYMTSGPFSIGPHEPIENARSLMRKHNVRQLPVWAHGALVGTVSDRDVYLVETLVSGPLDTVMVEAAMTADPYAPSPDTPLLEVVRTMAARKLGAAVVLDAGRIVGIFTATDAMRALVDALEGRLGGRIAAMPVLRMPPWRPRRQTSTSSARRR
jgi:acetoin utilization protein AcuB